MENDLRIEKGNPVIQAVNDGGHRRDQGEKQEPEQQHIRILLASKDLVGKADAEQYPKDGYDGGQHSLTGIIIANLTNFHERT